MADLSNDFEEVTQGIFTILKQNQSALKLQDLFYGDQEIVPRTPTAAVEAGPLNRTLAGAQYQVDNTFRVFVMVYHSKVQPQGTNKSEANRLAVAIQEVLHKDKTLGGLVIWSLVSSIEPGLSIRGGNLMVTSRIEWTGMSKVRI